MNAETIIVGGGLIGCWTAFFLARRGHAVTVLERDRVGAQASGVNYGNLRVQGRHPEQLPLSMLAHGYWQNFETLIGADCEVRMNGHVYVAQDDAQRAKARTYAEDVARHGHPVEFLEPDEARRRWPYLSGPLAGCSFAPWDGSANPRLATPAVARAAAAQGATIVENMPVKAIDVEDSGFDVLTGTGERYRCHNLVNAAGAWANEIAKLVGEAAPMFPAGPPQFVTEPMPYFMQPSFQTVDGGVIVRQVERGNLVVAGYPRGPVDPAAIQAPVPPAKTLVTLARMRELVPALADVQVIRVWSGIEGYVSDMLPVIGPSTTTRNLFHAFGFCGHGFQLAPGVGSVIAALIANGEVEASIDAFAIDRFGDNDWSGMSQRPEEFDAELRQS